MRIGILFLGASRLVGLLERFRQAATVEGVTLDLFSLEDSSPWHAIAVAGVAQAIAGPPFNGPDFKGFFQRQITEHAVDIVIPNIDSATISVAQCRGELESRVLPVVSSVEMCQAMHDKLAADKLFRSHELPLPGRVRWPLLAKPRFGSSSRGHVVFQNEEQYRFWASQHSADDYIVQEFLAGTEYSVDAFVDRGGRILGTVSRIRRIVSGGEVMVTETHNNPPVLELAKRVAGLPGWYGPLNIQIMDTAQGPYLLEVNPRFGSGVTCAIEAGLDVPRWILRERLGRSLPTSPIVWKSGLCMTRARKDYFQWLS
ncbi:MAG TPA: ATP-grasp domain-containing protein [Pirellulales bacterium]|nr:ATP-grasp domain-containing protein [Pirellulales bacterium]